LSLYLQLGTNLSPVLNKEALFEQISLIPLGLMLLSILTGLYRIRNLGKAQKVILSLVIVSLITEIISRLFWSWDKNTFPIFHIYALIEYCLLIWIFMIAFDVARIRKVLWLSILIIWGFGIINVLFFQPLKEPNTNVTTSASIIYITMSVTYFFWVLSKMKYKRIEQSALFWFNIGVLAYFSGSLLLFSFADWLAHNSILDTINVWVVHIILNFIHYLCFNIALWMDPE
jgi:hypothetical protein